MIDLTELAALIQNPIHQTWDAIGSDVLPLLEEISNSEMNEASMEMVLDAGRLLDHGGIEAVLAQALLQKAYAEHGWTKTVDALARLIPLGA